MAIKSLSHILPKWVQWKKDNISYFEDSAYPLPPNPPKFLGEIAQRFNIRNGKATTPFKEKIGELAKSTEQTLIPALEKNEMMLDKQKYIDAGIKDSYCLAEIKDFQGLSPKSHESNVPVYALTDDELKAVGAALKGMQGNRKFFRKLYENIAAKIITLLGE
jgi:hypothetical protein